MYLECKACKGLGMLYNEAAADDVPCCPCEGTGVITHEPESEKAIAEINAKYQDVLREAECKFWKSGDLDAFHKAGSKAVLQRHLELKRNGYAE